MKQTYIIRGVVCISSCIRHRKVQFK